MGFGDDLMLSAEARAIRQALDIPSTPTYWSEIFDHNPNFVKEGGFPLTRNRIGHRPYHLGCVKTQYGNKFLFNPHFKAVPGEIYGLETFDYFGPDHEPGFVVVEPHYKPDIFGTNKDWGWSNYQAVAEELGAFNTIVQVGPPGTKELGDVTFIETDTFRHALYWLQAAALYIGPEGGLHHAAAALGIPAVVIFGGHTNPKTTGYDMHVNLASDDAGCGNMFPCDHCRRAMDNITVEQVVEAAESLL